MVLADDPRNAEYQTALGQAYIEKTVALQDNIPDKASQYRRLYLLVHAMILVALGLTLYTHWGHDTAMHGWADPAPSAL
jgi:hypothetical protein